MQTNKESSIQDLQKCTVAIQRRGKSGIRGGTGVIVTNDGIILTCYHVVGNIQTKSLDEVVDVRFPLVPEIKAHAQPINGDPTLDIAFLRLQEKELPKETSVAELGEVAYLQEHNFRSLGFRNPSGVKFIGLPANGMIQGKTRIELKDGTFSPPIIVLKSDQIDEGMSGAPILDNDANRVIGIISDHYKTYYQTNEVYKTLSLGIPIESIIQIYPELKEKNPGLGFNDFLQGIRKSGLIYDKFEDLYVAPIEYNEIEKTLNDQRCVFIIGPAECGKTYTAIKLLWEYYKGNHIPKYIEDIEEATEIIKDLKNMNKKSLENSVICFEDPVGKTEYEPNKEFEESIGSIVTGLAKLDVYLIVTMREEIYEHFKPIRKKQIDEHVKKLNIGKPSYPYEKRKEMLLRWASLMECKWLKKEELKNMILDAINYEAKLPTSLNIKDFATETIEITTGDTLKTKLHEISKSTPERFARDIEEMKRDEIDKILFLCFPFISDSFSYDFVKTEYDKLLKDFDIKDDSYAFKRASKKFQYKIEIKDGKLGFSHHSYSEALPFLLLEDEVPTEINTKIFSKVLLKLADADMEDVAYDVAVCVGENFDTLPEEVRNELLLKLAIRKNKVVYDHRQAYGADDTQAHGGYYRGADRDHLWAIAIIVYRTFDKLPNNVREELLLKLADLKLDKEKEKENESSRSSFLSATENAADFLTGSSISSIDKPYYNKSTIEHVATWTLLAGGAFNVARIVDDNFDKLPNNVREEVLRKLSNIKEESYAVDLARARHYKKLPKDIRKIQLKFINAEEHMGWAEEMYSTYFREHLKVEEEEEFSNVIVSMSSHIAHT